VCTLSWLPRPAGYTLFFNRDERLTREPGLPPEVRRAGATRFLAPVDGDFGGTWIGLNQHGVATCLLNRYDDTPYDPGPARVSRGLLLAELLQYASPAAVAERLDATDLSPYQPFTIGVAERGVPLTLLDWNGQAIARSVAQAAGPVRTSSGRDQAAAERIRAVTWESMRAGEPDITEALLLRLHRSHAPQPGPFSVCMHREEAATRSLTIVTVDRHAARMDYFAGPPCVTTDRTAVALDLAAP
jgi:hypothetical protein